MTHALKNIVVVVGAAFAFFAVAGSSFVSGSPDDQADIILSGQPVPDWVGNTSDGLNSSEKLWLRAQHSVEGKAYAGAILYQMLSVEALSDNEEGVFKDELRTQNNLAWANISLSNRMYFLISELASKKLWDSQQDDRERRFLILVTINLMGELNQKCVETAEYLPTRMVDIDPSLQVSPLADPSLIKDEVLRNHFVDVLRQMTSNKYHNMQQVYYQDLKMIMDDSLPALLEQAYSQAPRDALVQLAESLTQNGLTYGRWQSWSVVPNQPNPQP